MSQRTRIRVFRESDEQHEVQRRVLTHYFPEWCAARKTRNAAAFDPDWSFLTVGIARWFLRAIDEGVVDVLEGYPTLPDGSHADGPFGNDKPILYREAFLETAAVGMLALDFGWRRESLTFQSPKAAAGKKPWAFDLLAFESDANATNVAIAGEAKWKQSDALNLLKGLKACVARGDHSEETCSEPLNHHRKYQGLLDHRPNLLWIIGPDAFLGTPDLVFRVSEKAGGVVQLETAPVIELAAAGQP